MKCKKIISSLYPYVDGELLRRQRRLVEAHLATCASCRRRVEEIREMEELFQGTLPVPPVPAGLAARIMAEARRRQPAAIPGTPSPSSVWNPLQWIAGLSIPMRLAAFATVLLALVAGLSLDGSAETLRETHIEQGKDLYGLEWFMPVPPGSLGSIYIAMADQPCEEESRR